MVALNVPWGYVVMFSVATVLGMVGAVAGLLGQNRGAGRLEGPHPVKKTSLYDLGAWANVIVGAVAAAAAIWVFAPESREISPATATAAAVSIREWDIVKVVGLSLIVGSIGSTFISSLQAKALALVKDAQATAAQQGLKTLEAAIDKEAPQLKVAIQAIEAGFRPSTLS